MEKLVVKINRKDALESYLFLLRPIFRLTDLEIKLVCSIIRNIRELQDKRDLIFSPPYKNILCKETGLSVQQLNNYIKSLKEKSLIKEINNKLIWTSSPMLNPPTDLKYISFVFTEDLV